MTTRTQFKALAARHGIEVEYHPGRLLDGYMHAAEFMLDAPPGKVFVSSGCHCDGSLSHHPSIDGTRTNWHRAHAGLTAIISDGFRECPDGPDCDICNPPTEESTS